MLGPKTDNSVTDSHNVNQVGHNSGTVNIGLTFEQHERNVRERLAELRADLERAHGAERALLQAQVDAAVASLSNLQADYQKTLAELADLKATLARYDNVLDRTKHAAADAALDRGDLSLAKALLTELSALARARRQDAAEEEAEFEFKLGEIAAAEIRWIDAAAHFATAARLNPGFETLYEARAYALREGNYTAAFRFGEDLLDWVNFHGTQEQLAAAINAHAVTLNARGDHGKAEAMLRQALEIAAATIGTTHSDYAAGLNNLAHSLHEQGHYADAEELFRQTLKICADTIGNTKPDNAICLNNLAGVVRVQGRCTEAEELYRQALEIGAATIGIEHPDYATHLNNLAGVVREQGRYSEAEGLYRQALEIDVATIGTTHPEYATHLNNLAGVVLAQRRYAEAEALYRQALAIHATTVGLEHSECARDIHNLAHVVRVQGRYAEASQLFMQALAICAQTLGDDHPNTHTVAESLLTLLQTHFPDDPEIPALQALLTPTP